MKRNPASLWLVWQVGETGDYGRKALSQPSPTVVFDNEQDALDWAESNESANNGSKYFVQPLRQALIETYEAYNCYRETFGADNAFVERSIKGMNWLMAVILILICSLIEARQGFSLLAAVPLLLILPFCWWNKISIRRAFMNIHIPLAWEKNSEGGHTLINQFGAAYKAGRAWAE